MQITIENKKGRNLVPFVYKRLFPLMYSMILKGIDKRVFDSYSPELKHSIQQLLFDREYLYCYQLPTNELVITLESNKIVGENSAKLCDICSLINYGSLDYPATNIFTKVFNYIKTNFWKLYKFYTVGAIF